MRIIAFLIIENNVDSNYREKSHLVLSNLAEKNGFYFEKIILSSLEVGIVTNKPLTEEKRKEIVNQSGSQINFILGKNENNNVEWDRFLKCKIDRNSIEFENDYCGSIPVYYSTRDKIVISNIMRCVEVATDVGISDFDVESVYGYLKFSHFIWDETAFKHIRQFVPDINAKFDINDKKWIFSEKSSLKATYGRVNLTDEQVAKETYELNEKLVTRSLSGFDKIILPLSSGYDSRMIFSVLSKNPDLKNKLFCFTYGEDGCLEVEAGRKLCNLEDIKWQRVPNFKEFLKKRYLTEIHDIFGSSLHMHGMYQLDFFDTIRQSFNLNENIALTSGFMTGVPAGQHNDLLKINSLDCKLTEIMNAFGQSRYWLEEELMSMKFFQEREYLEVAEERFKKAFNRAPGEIYQKSVVFDVWTRQRNFIGYYPRTLEWRLPVVSPHMNLEYANFFLSLSPRHLNNRYAVELMFSKYYPEHGKVFSNSNGLGFIKPNMSKKNGSLSKFFQTVKIVLTLGKKKRFWALNLDQPAVLNAGSESMFPLINNDKEIKDFQSIFGGEKFITDYCEKTVNGDMNYYNKLVTLQSLALSILK